MPLGFLLVILSLDALDSSTLPPPTPRSTALFEEASQASQ